MTRLSGLLRTQRRGSKIRTTTHPKRPRDPDQLAKSIIDIATGQKPDRDPTPKADLDWMSGPELERIHSDHASYTRNPVVSVVP